MKTNPNLAICMLCGDILHSRNTHHRVTCGCPNQSTVDGGNEYHSRSGMDLTKVRNCLTMAEAKRASTTIKLKNIRISGRSLADAIKTPSFYDVMVKKLGKKNADEIALAVRTMLNAAVKSADYDRVGVNQSDYCNAFGVMQGAAYACGFSHARITTVEGQPGAWFYNILKEVGG